MALRAPCGANKTIFFFLDSHSEIFISQPCHSGGLCNGFGHLHHHLLHLCILRPCWVCPSELLGSLYKANNIVDDNYDDNYDGRLVFMFLNSWLMKVFAADEDEKRATMIELIITIDNCSGKWKRRLPSKERFKHRNSYTDSPTCFQMQVGWGPWVPSSPFWKRYNRHIWNKVHVNEQDIRKEYILMSKT